MMSLEAQKSRELMHSIVTVLISTSLFCEMIDKLKTKLVCRCVVH